MNQTIYFRKDVWDKFKDELGKSNLVNQLLATHYDLNPREVTVDDRPLREPDAYLLSPKVAKKHPAVVATLPTVLKIPKEMQPKFCKEGHPIPYGRDKCLGKGCKYS